VKLTYQEITIRPQKKLTNSQTHFTTMMLGYRPQKKLTKLTKLTHAPTREKLTKLT